MTVQRRGLLKLTLGVATAVVAVPLRKLLPSPVKDATFFRTATLPLYTTPVVDIGMGDMTVIAVHSPITAKCVKLKASWTLDDAFDLVALHGEECENDVHAA